MKWREKSKRSEATLTVRMKHEDDYGMNGDSNLSHSVRASNKEDSQRTTTLTDNKKRDYENEGSSMHDGSCIGINYAHRFPSVSGHFTHCWDFRSVLRVVNSICRCTNLFNFWPVREFLVEIHTAKTVLWGVVFTPPVGYSRPPSAVNDPTATKWNKKNRESRTSEVWSKDGKQQVSPFYHVALYVAHVRTFIWIIMSSTRNRSIATNWRKNSMIGASIDTSRMALAWVVVLQILGVDGVMWTTPRWSQNDFSIVQMFCHYWEKSTNSFCIESILLASYDVWNLFAQAHPSWYRPLHLDHVRVEMHEIQDRSQNDGGSLENASWCISFSNYGQHDDSLCSVVFPYRWPWGRPFLMT